MKALIRLAIPYLLFAAGTTMAADPVVVDATRSASPPASTVICSEVLADLYTRRLAGMNEFMPIEHWGQGDRYRLALARDNALHASPRHTEPVPKSLARPFDAVVRR